MTVPVAAVMIATTVITTAMSAMQTMQQNRQQKAFAKAENAAAQKRVDDLAQQNANQEMYVQEGAVTNYDQISLRQMQEKDAASQAVFQNSVESAQIIDRSAVAADASGVAGVNVENMLRDLDGREASFNKTTATNLEATNAHLQLQADVVQTDAASGINQLVDPVAQRTIPKTKSVGMQVAGGLMRGLSSAYGADVNAGATGGNTLFA